MRPILKLSFTFLCCCCAIFKIHSQPLADSITKKIDDLFLQWNKTTPGCVVGIVRNDSLIYAKGFGMANLAPLVQDNKEFELAFSLSENTWNGMSSLQLMIKDIHA